MWPGCVIYVDITYVDSRSSELLCNSYVVFGIAVCDVLTPLYIKEKKRKLDENIDHIML